MSTIPAQDTIRIGQLEVQFRLDAPQTAGAFTMFEVRIPAAARMPWPHSHDAFDETVYGQEGVTTFNVAGAPVAVGPGDVLFIPRGVVHSFDNRGTATSRGLCVITPGILGPAYFLEIAVVVNAGGPPDPAKIREVMQRHGLRPVVPSA